MRSPLARVLHKTAIVALIAGTVSACDTFGNPAELFSGRPAPDEFSVIARAPLRMPGTRALPAPQLGAPSPLEPQPQQDAIRALLGAGAPSVGGSASAGEQELLAAANAAAANPEIRAQLEIDRTEEDAGPYEPPSLLDLISSDGSSVDQAELLEPNDEARRLQSEGVASAPINPEDLPLEQSQTPEPSATEYGTQRVGNRPDNRVPPRGTGPAFE